MVNYVLSLKMSEDNMKKILFVMPSLNMGGVRSSFLNLLYELEDSNLNISVLCFDQDNMEKLPPYVKIIPTNKFLRLSAVKQSVINKESKLMGLVRLTAGFLAKKISQNIAYRLLFFTYKKLKDYDVAISFTQTPNKSLFGGCNEFVLNKVCAKKKISFIHCDYSLAGIDTDYSRKIYKKFDIIATVTNGVRESFVKCRSELAYKTKVVYHFHQFNKIKSLSEIDTCEYNKNVVNFITVARLSPEKGHERMLEGFKRLKDDGYNFCWHIVGGGSDEFERTLYQKIKDYGLSKHVIMYGRQSNPYRYMKNADVLLVTSFHEAGPMVCIEGFSLGIPAIMTNTISSEELVGEKEYGIVCESTSESLYLTVKKVIESPDKLLKYRSNISKGFVCTNELAKKQFLDIIQ